MTFIDKKTELNDFFNDDEVVFYKDVKDLSEKLNFYSNNTELRNKIAKKGKEKYFRYFDNKVVADFIINKILGTKISKKFKWMM